jgi:hypothetical protein
MTATSRGRVAIAALIAVLVFGAAFAVRKATAGGTTAPSMPAPIALPSTPVPASGLALPVVVLPALRHPPRAVAPAPSSTPSSTPVPASPSTPAAPSAPATPPSSSGGGSGKGPVLVG